MADFNKKISETAIRIGDDVRFGYVWVFNKRPNPDGGTEKFSVQCMIPKTNTRAVELVNAAAEAAYKNGVASKWGGKKPARKPVLRDGDEEHPDDENYKGMWFLNCSSTTKPGVMVRENGQICEALDSDDFYSGCWGAVTLNFFPYDASGSKGVAAGLNNLIKTRDDDRLGGGRSAAVDFGDMESLLD